MFVYLSHFVDMLIKPSFYYHHHYYYYYYYYYCYCNCYCYYYNYYYNYYYYLKWFIEEQKAKTGQVSKDHKQR